MKKIPVYNLTATIIVAVIFTSSVVYFIMRKSEIEYPHYRVGVFLPDEKNCVSHGDTISKKRIYKSYVLSNDPGEIHSILKKAGEDLEVIKQNKDTVNGIDIVLNDKSTYQNLVHAFDVCSQDTPYAYCKCMNHVYGWLPGAPKKMPKLINMPE
jgi:hypothetical protein